MKPVQNVSGSKISVNKKFSNIRQTGTSEALVVGNHGQLALGDFDPTLINATCKAWQPGETVAVISLGKLGVVKQINLDVIYVEVDGKTYKVKREDLKEIKAAFITPLFKPLEKQ